MIACIIMPILNFSSFPHTEFSYNITQSTHILDTTKEYCNKYNKTTTEQYRVMRKLKIDPITGEKIKINATFQFKYIWDPYTGKPTTTVDPMGPLHFNPLSLVKHIYTNRLNYLYHEGQGEWEGYYGDACGAGKQCYINNKGYHPERYLFRIPIIDCYLTDDHNTQNITLGPELTDNDVADIDRMVAQNFNAYRRLYKSRPPSLAQIKQQYEIAITECPMITDRIDNMTQNEFNYINTQANYQAVNNLRRMR